MVKRYRVTLTGEERQDLVVLARKRTALVRMVRRVQALLLAAEGTTDEVIAEQRRMGVATLERLRRRFVGEGLDASLRERPRPGARPKLGPKEQASVVALACTKPPEGRHAGPCNSWPTGWLIWRSSRTSRTKPGHSSLSSEKSFCSAIPPPGSACYDRS